MSENKDDLDKFGIGGVERVEEKPAPNASFVDLGDRFPGRNAFQQALAARTARRAPIMQTAQKDKKRRWTVGFGPAVVPPLSTVMVRSQPRCRFQSERLINTGDVADLTIKQFFIGNRAQLPKPMLVVDLGDNGWAPEPFFDVCDPALFMTFQIQNTSGATATWSAAIVGSAIL